MENAEQLVRDSLADPSLQFSRVEFTGDDKTGQTCGYYRKPTPDGGESSNRFIVFVDGGGGQNPFTDSPSTPYPESKADFALNWRTQCEDLGYRG